MRGCVSTLAELGAVRASEARSSPGCSGWGRADYNGAEIAINPTPNVHARRLRSERGAYFRRGNGPSTAGPVLGIQIRLHRLTRRDLRQQGVGEHVEGHEMPTRKHVSDR